MTAKTKLLLQVDNGEKIAFWNFMVPSATLSEMNAPFCSDQGVKLVSSWRQVGLEIVQTSFRSNSHNVDEEAAVGAACSDSRESFSTSRCVRTSHRLNFYHLMEARRGSQKL